MRDVLRRLWCHLAHRAVWRCGRVKRHSGAATPFLYVECPRCERGWLRRAG